MQSSSKHRYKITILLSITLSVFLSDFLLFRYSFWELPNESSWGADFFYNFLNEVKVHERSQKKKFRVVAIGSSVAGYSFNPQGVEEELRKITNKDVEVILLSYAGMPPLDAYLMRKKILSLSPDLVVYPINFVDWRLYRAYVLDPKNGKNETMEEGKLILDALDLRDAPQSKVIFPFETFLEFWDLLGFNKNAEYLTASLFGFYQYKEIYWKITSALWEHRFGRNTKYGEYNGVQIPERVTFRGWTGKSFSFLPRSYMAKKGFYIQVVEEILREGKLIVSLRNSSGKTQDIEFSSPGWKKIVLNPAFLDLPNKNNDHPEMVQAELSQTWVPYFAGPEHKDWSRDELGVRLQQIFGMEDELPSLDRQPVREERIEDLRYSKMSEKEYEEYFYFRMLTDLKKRPGLGYIQVLADSKKRIAKEKFHPALHFRYMKQLIGYFKEKDLPVLLINNPENPITLSWYEGSDWYKDHISYLKDITGAGNHFVDFSRELPSQDFWDFHHLTFQGSKKMNSKYAVAISKFVE
ncbi:hypothetical protein [Leptospira sarikeiensis]|uniref:Uncharacterized protein n=1 Tax=Leptospira sarikeiensis TaxID=2484943 RepID=A0A4R9JZV5_9LEPT|nr:hypothetical protein [Leptospira sarikeiensis]TGL58929.1 hypothetical protein EHQ64_17990 [Leptospira sarikeiensis]